MVSFSVILKEKITKNIPDQAPHSFPNPVMFTEGHFKHEQDKALSNPDAPLSQQPVCWVTAAAEWG